VNPIMGPIAKLLSAPELAAVAAYYGHRRAAYLPAAAVPGQSALGARLATRGRWDNELPACVECHGHSASGVGVYFPPLEGQPAPYIANQLRAWQTNTRDPGPLGLMGTVAGKLSVADIEALSDYFSRVPRAAALSAAPSAAHPAAAPKEIPAFSAPDEATIPDDELGNRVRLGQRIFENPARFAPPFVGNTLHCSSCHLDAGRKAGASPLRACANSNSDALRPADIALPRGN
jgi:thiosulfate dehydrogenase